MITSNCEIATVEQLLQYLCRTDDAILFYGSFAVLGHDDTRDIDVLAITSVSNDTKRLRGNSFCDPQQPINLYVVSDRAMIADLQAFHYGGWWVTKTILGYCPGRNEKACIQLAVNSLIAYSIRTNIKLDGDIDAVIIQIASSLCVRYPTFIKSVAKMFRHANWLNLFRTKIQLAATFITANASSTLSETNNDIDSDRKKHYWEMLRLRPLVIGNDVVPATIKMKQAREVFLKDKSFFERLLGSEAVRQILVAIEEVTLVLTDLELTYRESSSSSHIPLGNR